MGDFAFSPGAVAAAKIFDLTLGADAAQIDTGAGEIPPIFSALQIVMSLRHTVAATNEVVIARFNNDSGTNYYSNDSQSIGGSQANTESDAANFMRVGHSPGSTAPANFFCATVGFIHEYASTTKAKSYSGQSSFLTATTNGAGWSLCTAHWSGTAAIHQITFLPGTANFKAGSRITIYGLL